MKVYMMLPFTNTRIMPGYNNYSADLASDYATKFRAIRYIYHRNYVVQSDRQEKCSSFERSSNYKLLLYSVVNSETFRLY